MLHAQSDGVWMKAAIKARSIGSILVFLHVRGTERIRDWPASAFGCGGFRGNTDLIGLDDIHEYFLFATGIFVDNLERLCDKGRFWSVVMEDRGNSNNDSVWLRFSVQSSYLMSSFPSGTFCSPSNCVMYASVSSLFLGSESSSM